MKNEKIIYYKNELEDEFSGAKIETRRIDEHYSYLGGVGRTIARKILYYGLARPFGYVYLKVRFGHKIINKEVLEVVRGRGYILFGNHTNQTGDPFIPQFIDINRDLYIIVHPDNVSMPVLGKLTPSLGALPLPDTTGAAKNFYRAVRELTNTGHGICIYPEAHIWPYYTKIRPFKNTSFGYAIQCDVPVFCFTNVYRKRRFRKTPRIVTYVDGPFYPDKSLGRNEQKEDLRNRVYDTMVERSKNNNVEMIKYVKVQE